MGSRPVLLHYRAFHYHILFDKLKEEFWSIADDTY